MGEEGSETRQRADRVWTSLIRPACLETGYDPVRAHELPAETITEPIISALSTDPLVIADLGSSPWNANVMIEVGFRLASGRSIVFLADARSSGGKLPLQLLDRRIVWIDPATPQTAGPQLKEYINECSDEFTQSWSSQYAYVDFQVPIKRPERATYTYANSAAARMYGFTNPDDMVGKPVEEIDGRLYRFMAEKQRKAFEEEQGRLFGDILNPRTPVKASVKIPLWFANHDMDEQKGKVYLPLLVQHRFDKEEGMVLMRTVYVDITSWSAKDSRSQVETDLLIIPRMFRRSRQYDYDVFLPFDSRNVSDLHPIREMLERFDCTVWFRPNGAEQVRPSALIQDMLNSRIVALPVGKRGLGRWEERPEVRAALVEYCAEGATYPAAPARDRFDGYRPLESLCPRAVQEFLHR